MQIVTGKTGTNHVKAEHDRAKHAGIFGAGEYVLNTGSGFNATIEASDTIRLGSGAGMMQGTLFCIEHGNYEDVNIDNGTTGYMRKDLIVAEYNKVADIESVVPVVIKGEPSTSEPQTPSHTKGNILEGAAFNQMPLYEVLLDGVNIVSITPLFNVSTGLDDVYRKDEVYPRGYYTTEEYSLGNGITDHSDGIVGITSANATVVKTGNVCELHVYVRCTQVSEDKPIVLEFAEGILPEAVRDYLYFPPGNTEYKKYADESVMVSAYLQNKNLFIYKPMSVITNQSYAASITYIYKQES